MVKIKGIFSSLTLLIPLSIAAAPQWQIVPNESELTFTATQNGAPVYGKFKKFTGDINFDPHQLNTSAVKIVVDMNSVSDSYNQLVTTLKGKDWFDVQHFPQTIFKSTEFTKTGENTYQSKGMLTIRDKTLPVTVNFLLDSYSPSKAHAKGSATISRTAFGVGQGEWANTSTIKDNVQVNFTLSGVKK